MGASNLDSIERAGLQDAPSPKLVRALSLRRKIIARNIELAWRMQFHGTEIIRAREKTGMVQPGQSESDLNK